MKRLFIVLIKYIPIIQMVGMLFNNILYSEWFRNINKNELDNKIIESAITFYFKDEDSGSTKTWNYFKTAN